MCPLAPCLARADWFELLPLFVYLGAGPGCLRSAARQTVARLAFERCPLASEGRATGLPAGKPVGRGGKTHLRLGLADRPDSGVVRGSVPEGALPLG